MPALALIPNALAAVAVRDGARAAAVLAVVAVAAAAAIAAAAAAT